MNQVVGELLQQLLFWQERAKSLTPLKAQKRLLSGLRCAPLSLHGITCFGVRVSKVLCQANSVQPSALSTPGVYCLLLLGLQPAGLQAGRCSYMASHLPLALALTTVAMVQQGGGQGREAAPRSDGHCGAQH